jgi:hypothetical protein
VLFGLGIMHFFNVALFSGSAAARSSGWPARRRRFRRRRS